MAASSLFRLLLFTSALLSPPMLRLPFAHAQCSTSLLIGNGTSMAFNRCLAFSVQNASIAWSFNATNSSVQIGFSGTAPSASGWVGWGINPTGLTMTGTQAFIAYTQVGTPVLNTYNVTAASKSGTPLLPGPISLAVLDKQVRIVGSAMTIYVHLKLTPGHLTLNHVWNRGASVNANQPSVHGFKNDDLLGIKAINMSLGANTSSPAPSPSASSPEPSPIAGEGSPAASPTTTTAAPTPCSSSSFTVGGIARTFASCLDLAVQGATLAWSLDSANNSIEVVFSGVAPSASGWVAWGLNPVSPQMTGTQALIAFTQANGTSGLYTYNVTAPIKGGAAFLPGAVDLDILDRQVQISGANMIIYTKLKLSPGETVLNHVWNRGPSVTNLQPAMHALSAADLLGVRKIDMLTGAGSAALSPGMTLKNAHGVINTVAWGVLFPLGVMTARYLRPFSDPLWFYLHIIFQCSAYALGVAGWSTGMKLGANSEGIVRHNHRAIGITLFAISTLQVMALLLRPKKEHKIRKYWNVYHHSIGYSIIALGIFNIFEGFKILQPAEEWRRAYIGVVAGLGAISLILEIVTWSILLVRKNAASKRSPEAETNTNPTDV